MYKLLILSALLFATAADAQTYPPGVPGWYRANPPAVTPMGPPANQQWNPSGQNLPPVQPVQPVVVPPRTYTPTYQPKSPRTPSTKPVIPQLNPVAANGSTVPPEMARRYFEAQRDLTMLVIRIETGNSWDAHKAKKKLPAAIQAMQEVNFEVDIWHHQNRE